MWLTGPSNEDGSCQAVNLEENKVMKTNCREKFKSICRLRSKPVPTDMTVEEDREEYEAPLSSRTPENFIEQPEPIKGEPPK